MKTALVPPIVFEDDAMIAFNKPAGLLTAPDRWDKTLVNLMGIIHEQCSPDWFNAHRLDKETSGILLCAKTKPALDHLCRQFELRGAKKEYLALVKGRPREPSGVIRKSIVEDPVIPGKMMTASRGKPAITEFRILESWRRYVLMSLRPQTGRTHQLRVHMVWLRCPITGDELYGNGKGIYLSELKSGYKLREGEEERPLIGRLALHAERLTVTHPSSGQPVTIVAPLPKDFEVALKYLRRFG